jgi:hypothetical protein
MCVGYGIRSTEVYSRGDLDRGNDVLFHRDDSSNIQGCKWMNVGNLAQ